MTVQAVVFDIGGVLEYTPDTGIRATWEKRLGLAPGEIDRRLSHIWYAGSYGTISEDQVYSGISEALGISLAEVHAFLEGMWKEYLGTPNTVLIDFFASLRPAFRTAILSNSFVGAREREREAYQFEDLCEFIIYSHEVGLYKPDPKIYALTCQRLGLAPEQVAFLDDNRENVEAACAFGIHGVLFESNTQAIPVLLNLLG